MRNDPLIPKLAVVTDIRVDTPDVKTFRVVGLSGKKPFEHIPGQCAMLSIPGVGEALFSITSSPTEPDFVEFSIKKCGCACMPFPLQPGLTVGALHVIDALCPLLPQHRFVQIHALCQKAQPHV